MSAKLGLLVKSVSEMRQLAAEVAQGLTSGAVLLLQGELGSGKTVFVQGLAQSLGVVERVTSPSFTVASEYEVTGHSEVVTLVHVDLYRLEPGSVSQDMAVRDTLERANEEGRVTVIEWAEKLGEQAPAKATRLQFSHTGVKTHRRVSITKDDS